MVEGLEGSTSVHAADSSFPHRPVIHHPLVHLKVADMDGPREHHERRARLEAGVREEGADHNQDCFGGQVGEEDTAQVQEGKDWGLDVGSASPGMQLIRTMTS